MNSYYYQILGLPNGATVDEIKRAYRKLAKQYHPDRYQDLHEKRKAQEKMAEINQARDKLLKPDDILDLGNVDLEKAFQEYEQGHDWLDPTAFEKTIKASQDLFDEASAFLKSQRSVKKVPLHILLNGGEVDGLVIPANTPVGHQMTLPSGKPIVLSLEEIDGIEYHETHFVLPYSVEANLLYCDEIEVKTPFVTTTIDLSKIKGKISTVLSNSILLGLPVHIHFLPYVTRN